MKRLEKILEKYENEISVQESLNKFLLYFSLLTEYNEKFNLTAVTEKSEVEEKHFIDSLAGADYIGKTVLDIGSGAGFPGIPLAIVNPNKKFTLIDSLGKRVDFLKTVINECGIINAEVYHMRAENLDKNEKYDTVTARAVAPLNILCEYCLPFVKIGGNMIAYKGKKADEETENAKNAVKILGGDIEKKIDYDIKTENEEQTRTLIIIKKVKETDKKYPRGQNKPRIKPL